MALVFVINTWHCSVLNFPIKVISTLWPHFIMLHCSVQIKYYFWKKACKSFSCLLSLGKTNQSLLKILLSTLCRAALRALWKCHLIFVCCLIKYLLTHRITQQIEQRCVAFATRCHQILREGKRWYSGFTLIFTIHRLHSSFLNTKCEQLISIVSDYTPSWGILDMAQRPENRE